MNENSYSVLTRFESPQIYGAEAPWVGPDVPIEVEARGKRVLLVEDEESVRACLRMMLELEGHQVTEASNGAEALHLFTVGEFDLVVTDYQMPLMQGNELALGIKLLAPSLPILMITAYDRARPDADNPVDAVLRKPFTVADLHGALNKLLPARREPARPIVMPPWRVHLCSAPSARSASSCSGGL